MTPRGIAEASPSEDRWKKYSTYGIDVDPNQDDKAKEIKLCDFSRPHMRAFHLAWWSFFISFFTWFSITPLLSDIRKDLGLSRNDIWVSTIVGIGGTIIMRLILGPLCDKYGARILFSIVLCATSIPVACTGLVHTAADLYLLRLFIGLTGGTFVMCQYWATDMFAKEIVGTANALVAGWGNLGGGVTQLVVGSALYPLFKLSFHGDGHKAWRTVCIVPAILAFISGLVVYFVSDDCPKGNYSELKKRGIKPNVSASRSFNVGFFNWATWILFLQYGCCFGVELTMNNAAAQYFKEQFGQSTESAAAIAAIFGWMNLFARGLGGFLSDWLYAKYDMQGRFIVQIVLLLFEGIFVVIFARTDHLAASILVLVCFSLFVQAAEGATYAIVPYVAPQATGAVMGIVGAGGNAGAVAFAFAFKDLNFKNAFDVMGGCVIASAFLTVLLRIRGHPCLLSIKRKDADKEGDANLNEPPPRDIGDV